MSFQTLLELLKLSEAPTLAGIKGIVKDIKVGYTSAKQRHEKASAEAKKVREKAEADAKKSKAELLKTLNKEQLDQVRALTLDFLNEFFEQFPNYGSAKGPETIAQHLHTRGQALAAFNIFKDLSARLDKLKVDLNKKIGETGKVATAQVKKFAADGERLADTAPPAALQDFVRKEARFFKRLVQVDDKFDLKSADFKQLLSMKLNATDAHRVPDAVQALNILLSYMVEELHGYAKLIGDVGRKLPDEPVNTTDTK